MQEFDSKSIYTIGHSNHPIEKLLSLLQAHGITTAFDIRTNPSSRFNPQFNRRSLNESLNALGIKYEFLGAEIGGRPKEDRFYDKEGYVLYERLASTPEFRRGIRRIVEASGTTRLALLCTEMDPRDCHRHHLLATYLMERNIKILHILRDESLLDAASLSEKSPSRQIPLLEPTGEDLSWRSPKPMRKTNTSPKRRTHLYQPDQSNCGV